MMKGKIKSLKTLLIIFFGASLTFIACEQEFSTSTAVYDESYCEPWGLDSLGPDSTAITDEKLKDSLNIFLRRNDIHVADISLSTTPDSVIKADTIRNCPTCVCRTGRRIEASIYTNDTTAVKQYGFFLP